MKEFCPFPQTEAGPTLKFRLAYAFGSSTHAYESPFLFPFFLFEQEKFMRCSIITCSDALLTGFVPSGSDFELPRQNLKDYF